MFKRLYSSLDGDCPAWKSGRAFVFVASSLCSYLSLPSRRVQSKAGHPASGMLCRLPCLPEPSSALLNPTAATLVQPAIPSCLCLLCSAFVFLKITRLHYLHILWFKLFTHFHCISFSPQLPINLMYWGFTLLNHKSKIVVTHRIWANILIVVGK